MLDRMKTVTGTQPLRIAYTPDSDDAFTFYAWQHGLVTLEAPGFQPEFHRDHVVALNRAAAEQAFDVVAVSSVAYPSLADRYWILSVGNSVGRGFGPVLVSKNYSTIAELLGKRIAVGGISGGEICGNGVRPNRRRNSARRDRRRRHDSRGIARLHR